MAASSTMLARATTRAARRALATSEASGKHVPWGASGSGTYTKSTKGCFDVIARAAPLGHVGQRDCDAARPAARRWREPLHELDGKAQVGP